MPSARGPARRARSTPACGRISICIRCRTAATSPAASPSTRYEFNNPTRENFYQGRVDYALTDKDAIFARYTYDGADQTMPVGFPEYGTDSVSRNQFFTTEYKRILTPALLNTARFSHSRLRFEQLPDRARRCPTWRSFAGQDLIGVISVAGLTPLGGTRQQPVDQQQLSTGRSATTCRTSKGRHLLKAGTLIEHLRTNKLTATNIRGTYTFANLASFLAGVADAVCRRVPEASNLERVRPNTLFGFYVQDDFQAADRLTLNLGLRYEFYTIPTEANGLDTALRDIFTDADVHPGPAVCREPVAQELRAAPRLCVGRHGRWQDRGSRRRRRCTTTPTAPSTARSASRRSRRRLPRPTPSTIRRSRARRRAAPRRRSARTIDYNIKQPYGVTYNVSLQRELKGDIVVTVGYAGSRGYNLLTANEGNPVVPIIQADGTKFFPASLVAAQSRCGARSTTAPTAASPGTTRLQLSAQKRFSRSYQLQVNYTFSKAMDMTQAQLNADVNNASVYPQDPYDLAAERARSDFDVRHVMTANFVWELPGPADHPLLGGWQLNGIATRAKRRAVYGGTRQHELVAHGQHGGPRPAEPERRASIPTSLILGDPDRYYDPAGFSCSRRDSSATRAATAWKGRVTR